MQSSLQEKHPPEIALAREFWLDVCALDDIPHGAGVAALVEGQQIALVRSRDGKVLYALSNFDPFSKAFVLSRGIVGDKGGVPMIASPVYKQGFALATGQCLDDPKLRLPVYPVRVVAGRVQIETSTLGGLLGGAP
jgi:nitrite reductase (NADH) small subunit